jgi:2-haloacid dehalogenase
VSGTRFNAVFLDFYGTLAAGDADAVERTCANIVRELNLACSPHEFAVEWGNRFFRTMDECHSENFQTLYDCECVSLIETCRDLADVTISPQPFIDDLFEYLCSPPLYPEVHDVLKSLPVPVCCVSNADRNHLESAIEKHQLVFDSVVCSEEARSYKPHPGLFEMAMRVMDVKPDEVLHVGDSLHSDVNGAKRVGIEAIWICRDRRIHDVGDVESNHKISNLNELHAFLGC